MRLDKYIGKNTEYTSTEITALIKSKRVCVNGMVTTEASHQVHKSNVVTVDGCVLIPRPFRYLMLNKPVDTICSNVDEKHTSVLNLLNVDRVHELHIAGRLDVDTTGLVLITDDGNWSYNLTSPKNNCEKTYKVLLSRPISADVETRFQDGILLQGETKPTLPAKLKVIDSHNVLLTITEGRYHQVKRMFAAVGNRVKSLHRQQIGCLVLDIEEGKWRNLSTAEVVALSKEPF